ncbi:amidase [Salinarimonas sp. NSM]|uniref:amidase n=1 Tax=Salinarimonas sp. NSM TaxID=3458003 RepID=UPI0040353520
MADIHEMTAAELTAAYAAGRCSPVEVAEAVIARRDRFEGAINAFVRVDDDAAMEAARASEARWRAGVPLGPADGVPATMKGNVAVARWEMRRGSRALPPTTPDFDAPATRRLKEAGAVLVGYTSLPELGWKGMGDSPAHGVTRNPWDVARTSGGSSAGAAAAAALGIGVLHVGTDGLGSVRIPCAFCGLAGLKPTSGRIPAFPASAMGVLAILGPMARTVADVALLLELMAIPDTRDTLASAEAPPAARALLGRSLAGLTAAFSPDLGYAKFVDADVEAACRAALAPLAAAGVRVSEGDPGIEDVLDVCNVFWLAGSASLWAKMPPDRRHLCDPGFAASAQAGERLPASAYVDALAARQVFAERMRRYHDEVDLLITPTMPIGAPTVDGRPTGPGVPERFEGPWSDWSPFTYPFNLSGQPAATVPVGLTREGLPIGLQIVARRGEDALVLAAAAVVEAAVNFPALDAPRGSVDGVQLA